MGDKLTLDDYMLLELPRLHPYAVLYFPLMTLKNVFLFTGDNRFAIREERRLWVKRFIEKHNSENLHCLEEGGLMPRSLLDDISVAPFIAAARLVIVEGVPRWTGEEMENLLSQIHPQVVLLFVSPGLDRRGAAVRVLLKRVQCRTFPVLKGAKLHAWIDETVRSYGSSFPRDARERLLELMGTDQDMLFQEIQKLAICRREITISDIDRLVVPSREWVEWHLKDILARGDTGAAMQYARTLLQGGQDPFALWAMLLKMVRNMTVIVSAVQDGERNAQVIAQAHAIHPFVVLSLLPLARRVRLCHMRLLIDRVVEMDHALKTGALRATADDSTELHALIDQAVLEVTGVGDD